MKVVIDIDNKTIDKHPHFIPLRKCSTCNRKIGYRLADVQAAIILDSTCDCTDGESLRLVTWLELSSLLESLSKEPQILRFPI